MLILIAQIFVSILLGAIILLQGGGAGIGSSLGGGITPGSSFRSRRGMEKLLLYAAGFLAAAFFATSLANFLI